MDRVDLTQTCHAIRSALLAAPQLWNVVSWTPAFHHPDAAIRVLSRAELGHSAPLRCEVFIHSGVICYGNDLSFVKILWRRCTSFKLVLAGYIPGESGEDPERAWKILQSDNRRHELPEASRIVHRLVRLASWGVGLRARR
jgi:hypothetical protein